MSTATPCNAARHSEFQALGTVTVLLGLSSALAACWIMYSATCVLAANKKRREKPSFLIIQVFWMCFCDFFITSWVAFTWLPVAMDSGYQKDYSESSCWIIGFWAQFSVMGSVGWNLVICLCLLRILLRKDVTKINDELPFHHLFVWTLAVLGTAIPAIGKAFGYGGYGYVANMEDKKYCFERFECWIQHEYFQLCLYIIAFGSFFFATFLLLFTVFIGLRQKDRMTHLYIGPYRKYTIVFALTWLFPATLRIYGSITDAAPPPFLIWLHHIGLASIGLGNAWVWGSSTRLARDSVSQLDVKDEFGRHRAAAAAAAAAAAGAHHHEHKHKKRHHRHYYHHPRHNKLVDRRAAYHNANKGHNSNPSALSQINGNESVMSIADEEDDDDESTLVITLSPLRSRVSTFAESEKEAIALLRDNTATGTTATTSVDLYIGSDDVGDADDDITDDDTNIGGNSSSSTRDGKGRNSTGLDDYDDGNDADNDDSANDINRD